MRSRLALCVLLLACLGFEWPGRALRIEHELLRGAPAQRRAAARMLAGYPARDPAALLHALEDDDREVRCEAAATAGRVRARGAIPILLDWLADPDASSRGAAIEALGKIGDPATASALLPALSDINPQVRRRAVTAIGEIGGEAHLLALLPGLRDPEPEVRSAAATALGRRRAARASAALRSAATDRDRAVRVAALYALGQTGGRDGIAALSRALATDPQEDVRLVAAAALGAIGDRAAVPELSASLKRGQARVAEAALAALGNIDHDSARQALVTALQLPALQRAARLALVHHARGLARDASWARLEDRRAHVGSGDSEPRPTRVPNASSDTAASGDPAVAIRRLVARLASALENDDRGARPAIAETLAELAGVISIEAAVPALMASLRTLAPEHTDAALDALARSGDARGLPALLDQLQRSDPQRLPAAIDAVQQYLDARAADQLERPSPAESPALELAIADGLLARLEFADSVARARIISLLGRLPAERTLPALLGALSSPDPRVRGAAIGASAALASPAAAASLLALLDSPDRQTGFEAALALGASADLASLQALIDRLDNADAARTDLDASLLALGGALRRIADQKQLPSALASSARQAISRLAVAEDRGIAARAVDALGVWGGPESVAVLAGLLRRPSAQRRTEAIAAIGHARDSSARSLLRYLLLHSPTQEATAAASALGELGDRADAPALMRAIVRLHWPARGAAAYAMLRLTQRGALSPHAARRALCELVASREPHVRANAVAGLALLGAAPCVSESERTRVAAQTPVSPPAPSIDPLQLLDASHAAIVRAAAARWLLAAAQAGRIDRAVAREALERCAAADRESSVRAACSTLDSPGRSEVAVYGVARDGVTPLSNRLVAVRSADGSVFIGTTDANGLLRVSGATSGPTTLEDPSLATLEPAL